MLVTMWKIAAAGKKISKTSLNDKWQSLVFIQWIHCYEFWLSDYISDFKIKNECYEKRKNKPDQKLWVFCISFQKMCDTTISNGTTSEIKTGEDKKIDWWVFAAYSLMSGCAKISWESIKCWNYIGLNHTQLQVLLR